MGRARYYARRSYYQSWSPILANWAKDVFVHHQPIMMMPHGLGWVLEHNQQQATLAYEQYIGDAACAAAADAITARQRLMHELTSNVST